jgi:hypothetical protein
MGAICLTTSCPDKLQAALIYNALQTFFHSMGCVVEIWMGYTQSIPAADFYRRQSIAAKRKSRQMCKTIAAFNN